MQNISIYLNQRASNGSYHHWKSALDRSLFRSGLKYRSPKNLQELQENLNEDIRNNVDAIVSVGGDGTVNTLIQELAQKDIGLLVIPGGTANDLANELGNNEKIRKLVQCIRNKEMRRIDLIQVNGRFMATNGGIGLGGNVASKINAIRQKFPLFKKLMKVTGKNIYSFFVVQELLSMNMEYFDLKLEADEYAGNVRAVAVLVNNQPRLAGTFNIAPYTSNSDGTFNVSILTHPSRNKLIQCIYQVASGTNPADDPHFISFETSRLKLEDLSSGKGIQFFGDGEIFECSTQFDIRMVKDALNVFAPDQKHDLLNSTIEVTLS